MPADDAPRSGGACQIADRVGRIEPSGFAVVSSQMFHHGGKDQRVVEAGKSQRDGRAQTDQDGRKNGMTHFIIGRNALGKRREKSTSRRPQ